MSHTVKDHVSVTLIRRMHQALGDGNITEFWSFAEDQRVTDELLS